MSDLLAGMWESRSGSVLHFAPTERPGVWYLDSPGRWEHGYYVRPHPTTIVTADDFQGRFDLSGTLDGAIDHQAVYFSGHRIAPPLVVL